MSKETRYAAFLIRWQDNGPQTQWRATVEHAYTGQKVQYSSKSELLRFLWQSLYEGEMPGLTGINTRDEA
jgi:hypothetical protein